jgi:hypothetical protein
MFKRLLLISGVVSIGILGVLLYLWQQTTQTPSWYKTVEVTAGVVAVNTVTKMPQTREQIWRKVSNTLREQSAKGESSFSELEAKGKVAGNTQLDKVLLGTNTQFRDEKMVIGTMLNLAEIINRKDASSDSRVGIAQGLLNLPIVKDRPVYVEIEGTPTVRNRQIALESPVVKLANVTLTIDDFSKYLGVSPAFLKERITKERPLVPMEVENVKVERDRLIVTGSAKAG